MSQVLKDGSIEIREVWNDNVKEEIDLIRQVIDDYPFVAMDTEFPGIVCDALATNPNLRSNEVNYVSLMRNVNMLKLIQLGLTLSDEQGNLPTCGTNKYCVWQFNFREFNPRSDMCANDSIHLLCQAGIDFARNNESGIESKQFAELLMSSGVVLNDNIHWLTFHGGYDFGYLLKLLTAKDLPEKQDEFLDRVRIFFPRVYDIKYLMDFCSDVYGGLDKAAQRLHIERVGISHQAGSDSLLTLRVFMKMKETYFKDPMDKYSNILYGLGVDYRPRKQKNQN